MTQQDHSNVVTGYVGSHGFTQLLFWSAFYYLLPALSAQIALETHWPVLHISTTYTLAFLLWAMCAPIVGYWIDAGHGSKIMSSGVVAGIILLIAISQTSDKLVFSVLVILLGACMAATLYDPCFAMMMRRLKRAGPNAVATVTLIAGFATLLTFPLVLVLSEHMTWQHTVLVFAGLAALGLIFLPSEPDTQPIAPRESKAIVLGKGPALIAVSFGLVMMGHAILLFLLPVALSQTGSETNAAFLAMAILGPAQIAGRIIWRYYGDAFTPQNCALAMFVCLCLPATLLLLFGISPSFLYIALVIQGACYGVHTILRTSLAQNYLHSALLGRGLGTIAMIGLLMMAVGPAVGGLAWSMAGVKGLMTIVLGLNFAALLLGLLLRKCVPTEVSP